LSVRELRFVSLAAAVVDPLWHHVAEELAQRVGAAVRVVDDVPWQEREQMLLRGEAHLGVICGLQYVLAGDSGVQPGIDLIAAPVPSGTRYGDKAEYFSDVVVPTDSAARSLADLRGARWAINEPTSHSGFLITRYALANRGETSAFFGEIVESGAHERSLELLLQGRVDGSAIDSTVLEACARRDPALLSQLRVVETLGPSPIPPLVASRSLAPSLRAAMVRAALELNTATLREHGYERFVPVADDEYDAIRHMARVANRMPPWSIEQLVCVS
jgi:phosphonate transport system substrate-binding protein